MKRSSSRLKFFLITITLCLAVYFSRHTLFAFCAEKLLSRITHEKFEYQLRTWEEGSLVYENVKLGEELHTFHLRLTPEVTLSPLHLALEVYLVEPHFKLTSQGSSSFNPALLAPTKWFSVKLEIERGLLSIDEEPLGSIDLVSGSQASHLGTVILSDEAGTSYCNCDFSFIEGQLLYQLKCESAPALYLHSFMHLFSIRSPAELQGGTIDAQLQGTLSTVQGSISASNLQLLTSLGEIDLEHIDLKGEWSSDLSVEGSMKGGRWNHDNICADQVEGEFTLGPQQTLTMNGHLSVGEVEGPFKCDMSDENGKLLFSGLEIPFSLQQETVFADVRNMPLTWMKGIIPFEEGLASAQLALSLDQKSLQLKNLCLSLVKVDDFTCNSVQGEMTIQDLKTVKQATLKIENFSYQHFKNGKGEITLVDHAFTPSFLTANWNHIPGKVSWQGPLSQIEGEVSAAAPLSLWSEGRLANESSAELKAHFQLKNEELCWQGSFDVFSIQGTANLKTREWNGKFESTQVQLANYFPQFSEGTAEVKGTANGKTVQMSCYGKELTLQTETQLLQIPGKTDEIKVAWQSSGLFVQTTIPPSTLHLQALPMPIHLEGGALTWKEGVLDIKNLQGSLQERGHSFTFQLSQIKHQEGKTTFAGGIPAENIDFAGDYQNNTFTFSHLQIETSKNTGPLRFTVSDKKIEGGMTLHLDALARYFPLLGWELPPMKGVVQLEGFVAPGKASFTLTSKGMTIGAITLPALQGEIKQHNNRFETQNLLVGDIRLQAVAFHESQKWQIPEWRALYQELELHGLATLDPSLCFIKAEGVWKETALASEVVWDFKNQKGTRGAFSAQKEGLLLAFSTQGFQFKDGKLEIPQLQAKACHPLLKDPLMAPLSLSWTPERLIFQGPFSQGAYESDLFKLEGRTIQALYEKGVLHFQTKLQFNGAPLHAKGSFTQKGEGVVQLTEGEHQLKVTLDSFTDVRAIEGKLFGIDCALTKKGTLFEGKLKIETSDPLATLFKKPEWSQIENLEFVGALSTMSFKGSLKGRDVLLKGYHLDHLQTSIDFTPTKFDMRDLKIEDPAGRLAVKECHGLRAHTLKAWEISIPYIRGEHIQPSLLKKVGETPKEPKPFQIRQLTLTHLSGVLGRPLTFVGKGSFYFTQKEKRDPSMFDLPRAFLKEWGLDLALLSPVRGTATIEIKQGKLFFHSLCDTFSDGDHSEFYLAETEPSYIDFSGALFLNLRMKQNVALKIVEPFTLSVRGTWQKPSYTLR